MSNELKANKLKYLFFLRGGYWETSKLITLIISNGRLSIDCY